MKIHSFLSTLDFAMKNSNIKSKKEGNAFGQSFDEIMKRSSEYIRKIVAERYGESDISEQDLNKCIIEDYSSMCEEMFKSDSIYSNTMQYIATKYIDTHRKEIPQLLKEIEERGLTYSEPQIYTDDFHYNLLLAMLFLERDFQLYQEAMHDNNEAIIREVKAFERYYGKEEGFKRYCDKYHNMKTLSVTKIRSLISHAYYLIFGLEGKEEDDKLSKSSFSKYKKNYAIKEYTTTLVNVLEKVYKQQLRDSIVYMFDKLNSLREIQYNIDIHNAKMRGIALPGLQYFSEEANDEKNYPRVEKLLKPEDLDNLDIEVLLRMNSFYNNRLAKVIEEYSNALFILDNTKTTKSVVDGETLTADSLPEGLLDGLRVKYETLILQIKSFYFESQKDVTVSLNKHEKQISDFNLKISPDEQIKVIFDIYGFIDSLDEVWKKDYENYFNKMLPQTDNRLNNDMLLINTLYNPIFLSYSFKNSTLKSEYAYMFYITEKERSKSLNYGVIIDNEPKTNVILLASDGGTNFPNRLHTTRRDFIDFITSYTGQPLVRVYEGFDDFIVQDRYISTQLLLPIASQHKRYLKDLQSGKLKSKGDNISRINYFNKAFVEHIQYCMDSNKFMESHKITRTSIDKNGNIVQKKEQPIRYMDLTTGIIYSLNEEGKLVSKDGIVFGEDEGR